MDILNIILASIYFVLPAYFANMAPVIVKNIPFLDISVSKGVFGKNKTYRGIFFGIIFGISGGLVQYLLRNIDFFSSLTIVNHDNLIILGGMMGLGAMVGDLVESYFKRRLKMKPGKSFFPFDQIDFVIGAFAFTFLIYWPGLLIYSVALVMSIILHIIVNHIAYYTGIRKERW